MIMLTQCPNCAAIWGFEEIDWQECDACGYPNVDDDEDFDPEETDDDDDDDSNDPNDSRNL